MCHAPYTYVTKLNFRIIPMKQILVSPMEDPEAQSHAGLPKVMHLSKWQCCDLIQIRLMPSPRATASCFSSRTMMQRRILEQRYLGIVVEGLVYSAVLGCSIMSDCLRSHGLQPDRLFCPWNFPGKKTGLGSHSLLQGMFLTQGSNLGLLHCRQILYLVSHQGSPW